MESNDAINTEGGAVTIGGEMSSAEGGVETSIPLIDSGRIQTPSSQPDSGQGETSTPENNDQSIPVACKELSDCSTLAGPCLETSCVDGLCVSTPKMVEVECDAECGTIVDECGNEIECGTCSAGFICVNNTCALECDGCEIDEVCYETGAVNPTNQCEICSPADSITSWTPNSGALCDDGKFCTVTDYCHGSVCAGPSRTCDDGIDCNGVETCSERHGMCVLGSPRCTTGRYCNAANSTCVRTCDQTSCIIDNTCYQNGEQNAVNSCFVCDSAVNKNEWTVSVGATCGDAETECSGADTCDASGNCQPNHVPVGTPCGSAETVCSGQDTCDGKGNCLPNHFGPLRPCETPAECENQDYCDGDGTCVDALFKWPGSACGNGSTVCSGQDVCDGKGRCTNNDYQDGTFCREGDSELSRGECKHGICDLVTSGDACDDGNPCTADGRRDYDGNCQPGAPVADGKRCGTGDSDCSWRECENGECAPELVYKTCNDDGKFCTVDICDPTTGECGTTDDTLCDDDIACTTTYKCNPYCDPTSCKPSTGCFCDLDRGCEYAINHESCDDGIPCTIDSCNPHFGDDGCQHTPDSNQCDDGCVCNPASGCQCGVDN